MTVRNITIFLSVLCFTAIPHVTGTSEGAGGERYQYRQTRYHVDYVRSAAELLANEGPEKCKVLFRDPGGPWCSDNRYVFIYDLDGTSVFDAVSPELEGKDLSGMKDLDGKPMVQHIIEEVTAGEDASGWVHYLWLEPGAVFPLWKSSFVMRVKAPSGKEYVIGSGMYNARMERQFMMDSVDEAVDLIKDKGTAAFDVFKTRAGKFVYMDNFIFVISFDGKAVVDPAFPSMGGRDLIDLEDAMGRRVVREMIEKLKDADSAWVSYMRPVPGDVRPSRKIAYVRKVRIGEEEYIVGSSMFQANPIWLKM